MKSILAGLLAAVTLAWGWDFFSSPVQEGVSIWWLARREGMYLTGMYAIVLMSFAMLLATRPAWLERPLGGMDRVYRLHKWTGILAISMGALHWLVEMSGDVLKALIGRTGRPPKEEFTGLLDAMRELAEELGEFAIYIALGMLVLTLWKRFPYKFWRYLHRAMPVLYLALAFHAALLAPLDYWVQPAGMLLGISLGIGVVASVLSLTGRIGRDKLVGGSVESVSRNEGNVTEVSCLLGAGWKGHRPGQFAFVSFDRIEGAHPFTIASADRGDRRITFKIKELGDYTRGLVNKLQPGQPVQVEGPYGRFELSRCDPDAQQIWIAGGIGVTPFLAWLESLQQEPEKAPVADLHYCTRDRENDAFVAQLQALCAVLPNVRLHVHGERQGERLSADALLAAQGGRRRTDVWFCGPRGLAHMLQEGLRRSWKGRLRFHQEAFEMR